MPRQESETIRLTPEEERSALLMTEQDMLRVILSAKEDQVTERISVKKQGKEIFSFRIRPLTEKEFDACRERHTKYSKGRYGGIRMPESTDTVGIHSALIYTATVDEDKALLWNNKAAWKHFNAITGEDMVDALLMAGTKRSIVDKIEALSGFHDDTEEEIKN